MSNRINQIAGLSLRQAAIVTAITYLTNPVSYAEFSIWPRLVADDSIGRTVQNINAHPGLFLAAIFCYLVSFIGDIVLAWSLYVLLAPVNRALSLLASWFQLIYAAVALCGVFNLVAVRNMLHSSDYLAAFGTVQLQAQVLLQLRAFHNDFDFALTLFGIHLLLLGYLVFRSGYIPRFAGIALALAGVGWIVNFVGPYVRPDLGFGYTNIAACGELVFLGWLLVRGWKIKEVLPESHAALAAA